MFKKEFKDNFLSLLIFTIIFILVFILVFAIYPSISTIGGTSINDMLASFPPELLDAFNMVDLSTPSGWISSEGVLFFLICGSIYASILGFNALGKEKRNGTIEFLSSKPITRSNIITQKVLADILIILVFAVLNTITVIVGLAISNDLDLAKMLLLMLTPLLTFLAFYSITLLLSLFIKPTNTVGISVGLPFLFYLLVVVSKLGSSLDFIKYFSPYTLSDTAYILENDYLSIAHYFIGIGIIVATLGGTYFFYNKKELI